MWTLSSDENGSFVGLRFSSTESQPALKVVDPPGTISED